jgi:pimeloyl-ACP methyl ester carboxylesterase
MTVEPRPRVEGVVRLADGRKLGFVEYGDADGVPIFWFHGTPGGSGQIAPAMRIAAQELGVRLIALERPGIGRSTRHLYDCIGDWAADVAEAADALGVDRFGCVGLSGGGPYVLACGAHLPQRMFGGVLLGSVAPARGDDAIAGGLVGFGERFAVLFERAHLPLGHLIYGIARVAAPLQDLAFFAYVAISPPGDQRIFRQPEMKAMFLEDIFGASRRQAHAPVLDVRLFLRDWGFALADVKVPIRMWHGDADPIVPFAHAQHLASLLPDAELRVRPGESHLGTLDLAEDVLKTLLALA